MNIEEIIDEKIELQISIRNFVFDAVARFEEKTGITPTAINIHLGVDDIKYRAKYGLLRREVERVEVIITI